jgi:hypothetical protein
VAEERQRGGAGSAEKEKEIRRQERGTLCRYVQIFDAGIAMCDAGAVPLESLFFSFELRWLNRYVVEGHSAVNRISNRGNLLHRFALLTQKLGKLVLGRFCNCTTTWLPGENKLAGSQILLFSFSGSRPEAI